MRVELTGGSYEPSSVIQDAITQINLYPETNPSPASQSPVKVTQLLTPGSILITPGPIKAPVRCTYRASNGDLYYVVGGNVYYAPNFIPQLIGTIDNESTPVSMADNGTAIILVDGSINGYLIQMATRAFSVISDPNFFGGDRVDYLNTFFLLNKPGTNEFYCNFPSAGTASNPVFTLNGLGNFGIKGNYADKIQCIYVMHAEVWLIGELKTEIWQLTGGSGFPFTQAGGAYIEHGCIAKYSVAQQDLSLFWLSQDLQGNIVVLRGFPYGVERISTYSIERKFAGYLDADKAIGFCYQQRGHWFYVLTFPESNATWVYDASTELWHQRVWTDSEGNLNRIRANCYANIERQHLVGDWENGNLYSYNLAAFTDYVDGQGPNADGSYPISRIRSFPHMLDNSDRISYKSFTADMAVGNDDAILDSSNPDNPPTVSLSWSDNRGVSYGNKIEQSLGAAGEYLTCIQWNRLGLARDRVFKLEWSAPTLTALNGAWIEIEKSQT